MAGTQIIGKVAVKVYPDTSEFRDKLKDQLRDEENSTDGIKVDVELDDDLRRQMRDLIDDLRDQVRNANLDVKVGLDSAAAEAKADKVADKFRREFNDIEANIDVDIDQISQEIKDLQDLNLEVEIEGMDKAMRQIDRLQAEIDLLRGDLKLDFNEASRRATLHKIAELKDQIEDQLDELKAEVEPEVMELPYRHAQARLAYLSRSRFVTLVPVVSKAAAARALAVLGALSGGRLLSKTLTDLKDMFKNFDKNLPLITGITEGVALLGASVLSTSANLFALSADLARIGPIALALPGVLSGAAIAMGVTVRAFMDAGKALPEFGKQWTRMGEIVSENFWDRATKPIQNLIDNVFPEFSRGVEQAGGAMGGLFGALANALNGEFAKTNALSRMFIDLNRAIENGRKGTEGFAKIIRVLGEQGAGRLPQLSAWLVKITNQFGDWLEEAEATGELDSLLSGAIEAVKELGEVVRQTARLLSGLARAAEAAGGTSLESLGQALKDIADEVNTPRFQTALIGTLIASERAMNNISRIAGPKLRKFFLDFSNSLQAILPDMGEAVGTLLGGLADALSTQGFQTGLITFFGDLRDAIKKLEPAFKPMGAALGSVLKLGGAMARAFSPILASVLKTISEMFIDLAPHLESVVRSLSGPLGGLLQQLATPLKELSKAAGPKIEEIGKGLGKLLEKVTPSVVGLVDKLVEFLIKMMDDIKPGEIEALGEALGTIAGAIIDLVKGLVLDDGAFSSFLKSLGEDGSVEDFKKLADAIREISEGLRQLNGAFTGTDTGVSFDLDFGELWRQIDEVGRNLVPRWAKGLIGLIAETQTWPGRIATALVGAAGQLYAAAPILMIGLGNVLTTAWNSVVAMVPTWLQQLVTGFVSANTLLLQVGTQIVIGLIQGISQAIPNLLPTATTIATTIINVVKALLGIQSPSTVFIAIGMNVVQGLINGLLLMLGALGAAVMALIPQILNPFIGAGTMLFGAGQQIVQGLIQGIGSLVSQLLTRVSQIKQAINDRFANAPTLLRNEGAALINGLRGGINSLVGPLLSRMSQIKQAINDRFSNASSLLRSEGAQIGQGLASGIGSRRGAVGSAASGLKSAARNGASGGSLFGIGQALGQGLANGLNSAYGEVSAAADRLVAAANRAAAAKAKVASPSKLWRQYGEWMGEGMEIGLNRSSYGVSAAAQNLVDEVNDIDFDPKELIINPAIGNVSSAGNALNTEDGGSAERGPLVGELTLQSTGDIVTDLAEIEFALKKIDRGGRYNGT